MHGKINQDGTFIYEVKCQFGFNPAYFDSTNAVNIDIVLEKVKEKVLKQYQEDLEEYGSR